MTGFSLWDQPWIPVTLETGQPAVLSLRDALVQADRVREMSDPSPLIAVAVHRLLQAVLYRVFRPYSKEDWAALWRAERFDAGRLDGYGAAWADRFDLFHPTRPFYQVPLLDEEDVHPISFLIMESAKGATLFDHGLAEGEVSLPPARTACHLVAHQLFAIAGGNSQPFYRTDGPLTRGIVVEAKSRTSLFETLLLNLLPLEFWRPLVPPSAQDVPFWEIEEPPEPVREGTRPLGPMHYLTWQTRQIHLVRDVESGLVSGCQVRQRYCLPEDGERRDPGKVYRKSDKRGWVSFKPDKHRAAWQVTNVLLQQAQADQEPPLLTRWLPEARATCHTVPRVVALTVSGLSTDPAPGKAAKIELWRREQLPLPLDYLERPILVSDLEKLLTQASWAERLLQRAALALVWALGERVHLNHAVSYMWTGKPSPDGKVKIPASYAALAPGLGLVTRFWPALEGPFRQVMAELPEAAEFDPVQQQWRQDVQRAAHDAFAAVRDSLLHTAAPFEVLTRIDHAFHARLAAIFAPDETKGGTPTDEPDSIE